MAASKLSLEAATAATSSVGSFAAFLDSLVDDQTISRDTAGIIKHALNAQRSRLEPAIRANLKDGEPAAIPVEGSPLGRGLGRVSMRDELAERGRVDSVTGQPLNPSAPGNRANQGQVYVPPDNPVVADVQSTERREDLAGTARTAAKPVK